MNYLKIILSFLFPFLLSSCFRFNGRIFLQNNKSTNLVIETRPIISSESGGWENGITYYSKDSIIWSYSLGNNIKARIIQPNIQKRKDSTLNPQQVIDRHYADYAMFRYDTSVAGVYSMYPNSSFTLGELNTRKKISLTKNHLQGKFIIKELIIYDGVDTLIAKGDLEIWNLLIALDKKNRKQMQTSGKKAWTITLE